MNNQGWIAAIVALLIGLGIGYFVFSPGTTSTGEPDRTRGEADRGPPSQLPAIMAKQPGEWPRVAMGGPEAIALMDQIYHKAVSDLERQVLDPALFDQVLNALYQCAEAHQQPTQEHYNLVQEALGGATLVPNPDWQMTRMKLDHED